MAEILGVTVDAIKETDLNDRFLGFLADGKQHIVVTPNAEIVLAAQKDEAFRERLNKADLHLPDSISLIFASIVLNTEVIHERITGVDAVDHLAALANREGKKLFLLGGKPGMAEVAATKLRAKYGELQVHGNAGGPIRFENGEWLVNPQLFDDIKSFAPDILAVALGHGKQEHFMYSFLPELPSVKIAIGCGGTIDYLSGSIKRAPEWMRKLGLEWLYRLIRQPQRIGRIWNAVVVFPTVVIWHRIKGL